MSLFGRDRRRRVVALLILLLGACASTPPPEARPLPSELANLVYEASRACERREPGAHALVRRILDEFPDSVDALRLDQNLRMVVGKGWLVHEEARTRREANLGQPAAEYLFARTIPDRSIQRGLFREITDRDPSFFFGQYGLAVASLASGDLEEARAAAERAGAIRPDSVDAGLLRAEILAKSGEGETASELYERLARAHPDHARAVLSSADHFLRIGRPEVSLSLVLIGLEERPGSPGLCRFAAWIVEKEAVPEVLLHRSLEAAARSGEVGSELSGAVSRRMGRTGRGGAKATDAGRPADQRFSELLLAGDYGNAKEFLRSALPPVLLSDVADSRAEATRRLLLSLAGADRQPKDARRLAELSRALLAGGFAEEAAVLAARAMTHAPEDRGLLELAAETAAWQSLLKEVKQTVERHYRSPPDGLDLDGLMVELGKTSSRRTGRDHIAGLPVQSFPFVGAVARSDGPGAPSIWSERGQLLVLGYRGGMGVEGTIARLAGRHGGVDLDGRSHDVAFVRSVRLASRAERAGNVVGGFTLPGWFAVDLDVADRSAAEIEELRNRSASPEEPELWPAPDEERRRSLWFPGGVRQRLAARIEDPRSAVLRATLAHEEGHVVDVRRYFPILTSLPEILLGFARAGFSPSRAEVELEWAAERRALLTCSNRAAVLLNTLGLLPYRDDSPPHSIAYSELVEEIIATLAADLPRYPAIDPGRNLLQQLHRLTDEELADLLDRALE